VFQFKEKQFLGYNQFYILIRLILALFCFIAYYWSENPKPVYTIIGNFRIGSYPAKDIPNSGEIFFLMGIAIILFSIALMFIPHLKINANKEQITLMKFPSKNKIEIPLKEITFVRCKKMKGNLFSGTLFNTEKQGIKNFFTNGEDAVELTLSSGKRFLIGTNKPMELVMFVKFFYPQINVLENI
jgi:hypothetical protein